MHDQPTNPLPRVSLSKDKNQRIRPILRFENFDACPSLRERESVCICAREKCLHSSKRKERGEEKEKSLAFPDEKHPVEDINEWRCIVVITRILSWFIYDGKIWRFERRRLSVVSCGNFFIHARFRYLRFTRARYSFLASLFLYQRIIGNFKMLSILNSKRNYSSWQSV